MKILRMVLAAGVMAAASASTSSAKVLTLDDCIELALKNRASIIAARGDETLSKWNQRTALGAFLPRVSAEYGYTESRIRDIKSDEFRPSAFDTLVDTLSLRFLPDSADYQDFEFQVESPSAFEVVEAELEDQDRSDKSLGVSASMWLLNVSNFFNYAAATAEKARAHLDVIDSEQDLIYSVKASYYAYLASVENIDVQEEAVKRSEEQLKLIESKFELGSAAKSDVLKQKVQYGNDKLSLLRGRNAVTTTRADLAYTIGVDPNSEVDFSTEYDTRMYSGTLQEAIDFGLDHEPGLLATDKSAAAAGHVVRARWAEYLPTLSGFASLDWSDGVRGDTVTFNFSSRSTTFGFRISYNIFDGFLRERDLSLARIQHNNARATLADTRNLVTRDIKTAYLEIEQLNEQKSVAQENVAAAEEDLRITQEKYNLGAATILDLLESQVSLKQAQVQLINADFDLNLAVAKLERAMGKM